MTQTQNQPQHISQPATALVTTSLEEMTDRLQLVLADKSASIDDVANSLGFLHDSTNNPQARALCDATWAAVQVLPGATDQALDIAQKALAAANTATQQTSQIRERHTQLIDDILKVNTDNPYVADFLEMAHEDSLDTLIDNGLFSEDPGFDIANCANIEDVEPETAGAFAYTLFGYYGHILSDERRAELSTFIKEFMGRVEIEERKGR